MNSLGWFRESIPAKGLAVFLSFGLALMSFQGCVEDTMASEEEEQSPDIELTELANPADLAQEVSGQYDTLSELAQNPGQVMTISLARPDGQTPVVVGLTFTPDHKPVIIAPDGRRGLPEFGLDGIKPVVRMVNPQTGETYLEQAIEAPAGKPASPADWISAAIAAIGALIVVWLGLKVISLSAIGLSYLILAGIVVGAIIIGAGMVTRIFDLMGWEVGDLVDLFKQSAEDLAAIISGALQKFRETYGL